MGEIRAGTVASTASLNQRAIRLVARILRRKFKMKIPGFTGEASLYKPENFYAFVGVQSNRSGRPGVNPQSSLFSRSSWGGWWRCPPGYHWVCDPYCHCEYLYQTHF